MIGTKEQGDKPKITEEDVVIIKCDGEGHHFVAFNFAGEHGEEAKTAYKKYEGALFLEGGEAVDLIEQLAADFSRITHGLSASRVREIVSQKQEELDARAGD